mmetsp:Transcript_57734/g.172302  ORF Transcript_57734/g.172302 Transcript_57734/m.172302 type:complete len:231 (+) Transcript_57734:1226-1918(+)
MAPRSAHAHGMAPRSAGTSAHRGTVRVRLGGVIPTRSDDVLVLATEPRPAQSAPKPPWQPVRDRVTPLDVHNDLPPLDPDSVGAAVRHLHVLLMLVLHERVPPALPLPGVRIAPRHELQILHGTERLELPQELPLGHLVSQPSDEQCVVAVHPAVFPRRVLLGLAVRFHDGGQPLLRLGRAAAGAGGLDRFGGRTNDALRGGGALELIHEVGEARDGRFELRAERVAGLR